MQHFSFQICGCVWLEAIASSNEKLPVTKGIATRSKDATRGAPGLTTSNNKATKKPSMRRVWHRMQVFGAGHVAHVSLNVLTQFSFQSILIAPTCQRSVCGKGKRIYSVPDVFAKA